MTAWAHLPNAKHIDWVLASINKYPTWWCHANTTAYHNMSDIENHAWCNAWHYINSLDDPEKRQWAWESAKKIAYRCYIWGLRNTAANVIMALIAYDDCGYMIESDIGELKLIAAFGDPRAILLLPACIVYNETKGLV
jgi:hypothetical protein